MRDGIRDMPTNVNRGRGVLTEMPQTDEDLAFGREELEKGLGYREYFEELKEEEAMQLVARGFMVSPAFVRWEGLDEQGKRKGRFVQAFHIQSQQWKRQGTRMETKEAFASLLRRNDNLLSFDIKAGYRHFFLHPDMRNYFIFRYDGRYFRCIALPFGWGRSAYWFVNLLKPFVLYMRETMGMRVLPYIDDFLLAPVVGRASTCQDFLRASLDLEHILNEIGLERHTGKGVWGGGATRVKHLGVV